MPLPVRCGSGSQSKATQQELKIHEETGRQIATISSPNEKDNFCNVIWNASGRKLLAITSSGTSMLVSLQEAGDHDEVICHTIANIPPVNIACFCTAIPYHIIFGTETKQVFLYDLQEQAILQRLCELPDAAQLIQLNASDDKLAVACKNGQIFLYENWDKICSSYFVHDSNSLSVISFHPSAGHILAGGSSEGNVSIWDIKDDTAIFNFTSNSAIVALTFKNSSSNEIIFADNERNVYMFDYYTSICTATFSIVYDISYVYSIKDSTDFILSTSCGQIFKYNIKTDTVSTIFKKEEGYKIRCLAFPPHTHSVELGVNENKIISGCGDNGLATSATSVSFKQKIDKTQSKWIKPSESQSKIKQFGARAYHIVDDANIEALYNGLMANTKEMLNKVIGEMNNDFLKMRMDISRIFCMMERRDRTRWHEFNSSLLKLADNETEIDGEFIDNSGNDIVNIH